jgi:hypothetical protein
MKSTGRKGEALQPGDIPVATAATSKPVKPTTIHLSSDTVLARYPSQVLTHVHVEEEDSHLLRVVLRIAHVGTSGKLHLANRHLNNTKRAGACTSKQQQQENCFTRSNMTYLQ